jgi:DNA polymerase-1
MSTFVLDIETDSLTASQIWCVVIQELKTNNVQVITTKDNMPVFNNDDIIITHNGIEFDIPVLNKLWNTNIKIKQVRDTLVMSRLFNPNRDDGHSLNAWGKRLAYNKIEFHEFDRLTDKMIEYCKRDVAVTEKIYLHLLQEGKEFSEQSIQLEHNIAHVINQQSKNGFYLDVKKANSLYQETYNKAKKIEEEIKQDFKPIPKFIREVTPRIKKDGSMSLVGLRDIPEADKTVGGPFSYFKLEPFNLASPKQIIARLDHCGWSPTVFTPKGSPKICEQNLETISNDAPLAAKKLAEWKMLESRWKTVESWLEACESDNRVHGKVIPMGAVTGRMTHAAPNMANVVSSEKPYGRECRECFTVEDADNFSIVGMDAKGLELRMLAHYMRDEDYIDEVLYGDPHTVNQKAAGLSTRAQSKTFIYAFLYGAGAEKLGSVVGGTARDGAILKRDFLNNMPALNNLITRVQKVAEKGDIKGLDGRRILVRHQHAALNTLLQGAGAIACKQWSICMHRYIKKNNLKSRLVNTIHDELQYEVHNDDVQAMVKGSDETIRQAGQLLGVRLPLNADAKVGRTWADTH